MTAEEQRLEDAKAHRVHWWRWGPYLSERQWGTVREDYSPDGDAWNYFTHDHARSRAYRWGEDGIAGICDRHQRICFALAFWNERDPILKERLFGLTNQQGNHGEDVKEYYFYLDALPSSAYLKYLYKYPQEAYPYQQLIDENGRRSRNDLEYELLDTGIFDQNRYFDIFVEYAKVTFDDVLIRVTAINRGPDEAPLRILPHLWFRNKWAWGDPDEDRPGVYRVDDLGGGAGFPVIELDEQYYGKRWLLVQGGPELLFTENETNNQLLFNTRNRIPYVKDAFHRYIVNNEVEAINPAQTGTKMAAHYPFHIAPGASVTIKLRLTAEQPTSTVAADYFGPAFDDTFTLRQREADEFYARFFHPDMSDDAKNVQRQAFAGLLWNKQSYHYEVQRWLDGDPGYPPPPEQRRSGRNHDWITLYNADVISMPDKWEYPWYATWDLAFHCMVMALIDSNFAKRQLILLLREWYMHPSGKVPAYEWSFDDANPPVLADAALRVYQIDRRINGTADRNFLERAFQKLLLNFTWWVNRKDPEGLNIFEGGFLGLDNIGIFDPTHPLPGGLRVQQSDATSWMMWYSLSMASIALELAHENSAYEDLASKFFEHCVYISDAMDNIAGVGLWDEQDGFYYDMLKAPDGEQERLKVRSLVGLIPLFAVETLEPEDLEGRTGFLKRMQWFLDHHAHINEHVDSSQRSDKGVRHLVALVNKDRLVRILRYVLDENEFLSPYGIRSLSKFHEKNPYTLELDHVTHAVNYEPAESTSVFFGGNSNWRGPVWVQMNMLIIEALQRYDYYYGKDLKVECPTGSGQMLTLWEVAEELSRRLSGIFLRRDNRRAVYGNTAKFQQDPHWRDLILFYEYFHGDNGAGLGASHQTGWTALVAKLLEQSGE